MANESPRRTGGKELQGLEEGGWYNIMETDERERSIYRVACQKARTKQDVGELKYIKDQQDQMLIGEIEVRNRWREYFNFLLNVENEWENLPSLASTEGPVQNVCKEEVRKAIKNMRSGKSAVCSRVTIELIKALDEKGVEMILSILESMLEEGEKYNSANLQTEGRFNGLRKCQRN
ncbi:uncharacterized protein LOC125030982 [Penaeus chinensis]|uniref:uncharacterized protein LOC125030982 n=1 Tax=Penaeus chinensis TaxID=139456 RepID=UPI001FB674C8|nr:uncharacterized protein LOC125030982 [Penaeus chinensis]